MSTSARIRALALRQPGHVHAGGRRAIVLVLDACGVGALPDARDYGDEGTNTLAHVAEAVGGLELPTLRSLGLGSIVALQGVAAAPDPVIHGRLHPLGPGKDSTTGHWELMGVVLEQPAADLPEGFPPRADRAAGRGDGPRDHLQPPLQRHRGDRGLRRRAPAHAAR